MISATSGFGDRKQSKYRDEVIKPRLCLHNRVFVPYWKVS